MKDRLLPCNIEAEQSLLGCLLLDPSRLALVRSVIGTGGELFYDLRHQRIFDAMAALEDQGKPVGTVFLFEVLKQRNQIESIGGIGYLTALTSDSVSGALTEHYLEILIEKASLRRLIQVCTGAVTAAYESDGRDAESIIAETESEVLKVRRQKAAKLADIRTYIQEAIAEIERIQDQQGISGLSTGLIDLDTATDGLHPGEMVVVAGYPGAGKTCLGMNIAETQAVDCGNPVGIFSLEMTAKRLVMRLLAARARVNMRNIIPDRDYPKLVGAAGKLSESKIHICDIADLTIAKLRAQARRLVQQHGIKLFVVDYIQLISHSGKKDANREQEVANISRGLKMMAAEFNVPVIALSQLNDDGKLRESRAIGQDADSIWRLRVEDEEKHSYSIPVALEIRKQRDGKAPDTVPLSFIKCFTKFETRSRVVD